MYMVLALFPLLTSEDTLAAESEGNNVTVINIANLRWHANRQ